MGLPAAALLGSHGAAAQQEAEEKTINIQMIKVVGQATSGLDSEITDEALDNHQAEDLDDVFRAEPSVSAGGAIGMSQKVYVRNVGEDILNITVDGAEQANAVFHHSGRISLEPELLKRVEVEAGAGSATAGPGALGGAIKFTTKDPDDLLKPGKQFGAILKAGVSSNGDANKGSVTLFGQSQDERFGGMVSLVNSSFDNQEDGDGEEILGSESEQNLGYAKLVANLSDEQYLSLSYEQHQEEGDVLYRPEWLASAFNIAEPTEGERKTTTLNYGLISTSYDWLDLRVTAYTTEYYQKRYSTRFANAYDGAVESTGFTLQNTSLVGNHELVYGINYRDDESYLNDSIRYKESGSVRGLYLQDVIDVNPWLTVSTGVRFDEYELKDEDGLSFSESGLSPNLSANIVINSEWSISAGYAEAFRGPEVEDAFRVSSSTNDPDLEAETAKNTELAVDFSRRNFQMSAGVFQTIVENAILRTPPWSRTVTNLEEDIETEGFFINLAYGTERFDLSAKYLSADTEVDGEAASRYLYGSKATSIGDTLVLDADFRINNQWQAGWVAEFVQSIDDIEQEVGGEILSLDKSGYDVHDVYLRWQPLKEDLLTLNLSVNNLFDQQYLSHASIEDYEDNAGYEGIVGSPEPGRDIRFSATWRL